MSNTDKTPVRATTQSFTEIIDIQDDVVILKDFSAATVVEVGAVNFWLLSQDEQESMIQSYANLLNSLSFPVQILIVSKQMDISVYLNYLQQKLLSQKDPFIQKQLTSYTEFIKNTVKKTTVLEKRFFFVVPFSPLEMGVTGANTKGLKKDYVVTRAKAALYPKRDNVVRLLMKIGLKAKPLMKQELAELYYNLFNHNTSNKKLAPVDTMAGAVVTGVAK